MPSRRLTVSAGASAHGYISPPTIPFSPTRLTPHSRDLKTRSVGLPCPKGPLKDRRLGYFARPEGRRTRSFGWDSSRSFGILGPCRSVSTPTSPGQLGGAY